jgi:hypothetical protein
MAILGVIKGFSKLPEPLKSAVVGMQDSLFIYTDYSFKKAVDNTYKYALDLITEDGGTVKSDEIWIKNQDPVPAALEISFPKMVLSEKVSIFDEKRWKLTGKWQTFQLEPENSTIKTNQSKFSNKKGDVLEFEFEGTAISLEGNWTKDAGKADVFVDGQLHSSFDSFFYYNNQEQTPINICHVLNLSPGKHTLKVVITGEKKPESLDSRIYVCDALVFKTE